MATRSCLRRFLLVLLLTNGVVPNCSDSSSECAGPGDAIDPASDAPAGELPSWAIGGFGRHDIDITNYWIEADGTAFHAIDGGDFGGCGQLTATFSEGRVHLLDDGETVDGPHRVLVTTTDGRFFEGDSGNDDTSCGWKELEGNNLCGRDVGGCGGYGSSVVCEWDEIASRQCRIDSDDGGDAGGDPHGD